MASVLRSAKAKQDAMSSLADSVENLKISTLMNAAKISLHGRTIGPKLTENGLHRSEKSQSTDLNDNGHQDRSLNAQNNNNDSKTTTPNNYKFRKDVWREVNIDSEHEESPKNSLHLNDCKAIRFRLALNNAEKQRRAKISTDLQEKQSQWDTELEQRLQQIRIDSAEKQKSAHAKRLEREKLALKAIETIENQAKQDEIKSNAKKTEMIEHSRKLIEHANQLKRQDEIRLLIESINASKVLFINLFELYAKTIINFQTLLHQMGTLNDYTAKRDALLKRYEEIINLINSKQITLNETDLFETLCSDIKQEQIDLNSHIQSRKEALSLIEKSEANKVKNAIDAQVRNESTNNTEIPKADTEVSVTDGVARRQTAAVGSVSNVGSKDRIDQYNELMKYYEDYKAQIQPLIGDVNMKKFRFNCQKGVNTPVNSISAVSVDHLQDKFEKITALLSGNTVRTGDVHFSAAEHPLGVQYCTLLLAKKFLTQGITVTSSHASAAFPIAAVIVSVWQLFPDVGKLFLALLYTECPFFVPYFIPQRHDQTENDYFSLLGYKFNDGKMEEQEQYLKRISGLQRLYSAILITKLRRSQQHAMHPHGLENGWIWFTNFLMLDPLPAYRKQFIKLLIVLHEQYISKLDKVDSGGPHSRLKDLVSIIVRENRFTPPAGTLQQNFW